MWDTVRDELRAFAGAMIFCRADWGRPWNTLVSASDASLEGYGVCTAHWPRSKVAATGRVQERSRFRRVGSHKARESALAAAGLTAGGPEEVVQVVNNDRSEELADWALVADFPEVPAAGLRKQLWTPRCWGRWHFKEDIHLLEGRALILALEDNSKRLRPQRQAAFPGR